MNEKTITLSNSRGSLELTQPQAAALLAFAEGECVTLAEGIVVKDPGNPNLKALEDKLHERHAEVKKLHVELNITKGLLAAEKADNQKLRQRCAQLNSEVNMSRIESLVIERDNLRTEVEEHSATIADQREMLSAALKQAADTKMTLVVSNYGGVGVKVGNKVLFHNAKVQEVTTEHTDLQIRPITDTDAITLQRTSVNVMGTKWEYIK